MKTEKSGLGCLFPVFVFAVIISIGVGGYNVIRNLQVKVYNRNLSNDAEAVVSAYCRARSEGVALTRDTKSIIKELVAKNRLPMWPEGYQHEVAGFLKINHEGVMFRADVLEAEPSLISYLRPPPASP